MSGPLTHSPADIIRKVLVTEALGTLPSASGAYPIYVGLETNTPDAQIKCEDTSPVQQGRTMVDGRTAQAYGVQVQVRDRNHKTGYTKIHAIAVSLDEDVSYYVLTIDSTTYTVYSTSRTSGPLTLGKKPGTKLNLFTHNIMVTVQQTS